MIEVSKDGARVTLTINRPDKANSLTPEMLEELDAQVAAANADGAAVLVLTGIGKVFSAGADLDAARAGLATSDVWERLSGRIAESDALTICALNGTLAGGACGMALACDLRFAVPTAKVFYPVMKLGFLPQPSDPARLRALVGPARAKLILMGGAKITAQEAYDYGLIDRIVDPDAMEDAVAEVSVHALAASPEHRTAIKAMCRD